MPKILIIRFSSIGDIVLTTPVVRCIKQQVNGAEVHYLTKKQFAPILENNPYVDILHTIEKDVSEVISQLKKENFDHVIDLHHNLRTFEVKRKLGKPSTSFNKLNIQKLLKVKLKIDKLPNIHIVDRYFETAKKLGVKNDNGGLDYFIPAKDEVNISSLPSSHQKDYVGFVIGAAHYTKQLPVEKIISICKKINKPIVLLGGKEDVKKANEIERTVGSSIYNAVGKYNLNQSASLVKQADLIITHDTGIMHIASAFNKKIISVWGNTVPEFGMSPYYGDKGQGTGGKGQGTGTGTGTKGNGQGTGGKGEGTIVEVKDLSCRPCSKIGYDKCPKVHFKCMNLIDENEILSIVERG